MYVHKVQYYETDKMGISHHANYIRWMEEARVDYLASLGFGYEQLEKDGIVSPVLSVNCDFKKSTTFPDEVFITVSVTEFVGIRLKLHYEMKNAAGEVVCLADSQHGFFNAQGGFVRLKKDFPAFYEALIGELAKSAAPTA